MDIHWITIAVQDLEKSKDFYRDYLGMKAEKEFSPNDTMTIAFFASDNGMKIELICNQNSSGRARGNDGISIGIRSHDYDRLLKQARAEKIITAEPAIIGGQMECFFVSDPDGVGIQIIKPM